MRRLSLVTLVRVARCYRPRRKVCKLALFGLRCPSNSCRRACRDRHRASMTLAGARSTLTQTSGPRSCHLAVLACCRSRTEPSQHIVHVRDMWSWFRDVVRGTNKHVHPSSIVNVYGSSCPIRSQHLPRAHVLRQETKGDDRRVLRRFQRGQQICRTHHVWVLGASRDVAPHRRFYSGGCVACLNRKRTPRNIQRHVSNGKGGWVSRGHVAISRNPCSAGF